MLTNDIISFEQLGPGVLHIIEDIRHVALDKVLSNWVFWAILTHPFLIEFGYLDFLLGTVLSMGARITDTLFLGYLPHKFNLNCFFRNFNWVNTPKSSLSKALI